MRFKILLALFLLPSVLIAEARMSFEEQDEKLVEIARRIRHLHYVRGYDQLSNEISRLSLSELNEHVFENETYESSLERGEVSSLYACFHSNNCELFLITLYSEFMSGSGIDAHFILLNPTNGDYRQIVHRIFEE